MTTTTSSDVPVRIAGVAQAMADHEMLDIRSPATGKVVVRVALATRADVDRAVSAARQAGQVLAQTPARARGDLLLRVAEALRSRSEQVAHDLAVEQGKPIAEARAEIAVAVEMWRDAAEIIRQQTDEILPSDDPDRTIVVVRRPHGVLAVITPWNFPATIPTEYLSAGLAAGNAIAWKPSELTTLTAVHLAECIEEAGFPPGSVNLLPGLGADTGARLVAHPGVDAIGFTGSPAVGHQIAREAGAKPVLLELGGNNATIVLEDADIDQAALALRDACYANGGQICSSTERIIVHRSVHDDLAHAVVEQARSLRLGPSLDEATTIGPLNNEATAAKVDGHLADVVAHGGRVLTGGTRQADRPTSLYYEPTVAIGLTRDMVAFREETFGPVAMLATFDTDDQAVALVNGHELGLIAGVLGTDGDRMTAIGTQLRAGIVNIGNVATYWQPHTPFGGWSGRSSGVGRLGGKYTIEALSQLQTFVLPRRRMP